jgi:hypothetical protein
MEIEQKKEGKTMADKQGEQKEEKRPRVRLIGRDGNAFAILGACRQAARKAGWSPERIKQFTDEATSGDYNKLLCACMKYFDVR